MLANSHQCYGCMACVQACPHGSINVIENKEGFLEPQINKTTCVKCNICEKVCPALTSLECNLNENILTRAAWSKSDQVLKQSSSGGIFYELACKVIENNGVAFGATMDENLSVYHTVILEKKELERLQTSKYVQSDIKKSYKLAKEWLLKGRVVLFSGTPCQIAGLYMYLGNKYDNLYTIDFICHGVPSPGLFKKYIIFKEKKANKTIKKIEMRSKKQGWNSVFSSMILYNDGTEEYFKSSFDNPYMNGFLNNLTLRTVCYSCQFAQTKRIADITLGDFWGIGKYVNFPYKTSQGVSVVMLNSKKGVELFEKCKSNCVSVKRELEEVIEGQPMLVPHNFMNKQRGYFFKDYQNLTFEELKVKYLSRKPSLEQQVKTRIRSYVGYDNVRKIKKFLKFFI